MVCHILACSMLTVLAAGAEEAPPDLAEAMSQSLSLKNMKASERPADAVWPAQMGENHGLALVPHLRRYMENQEKGIQFSVIEAMSGIKRACETPAQRRQLVDELVRWFCLPGCREPRRIVGVLDEMRAEDFSDSAKEALCARLVESMEKPRLVDERSAALAVGIADVRKALPLLAKQSFKKTDDVQSIASAGRRWFDSVRWHWLRARARMGVEEDILLCIRLVEAMPKECDRATLMFEQLAYVRQPEIVEHLKSYAFRDDVAVQAEGDILGTLYCEKAIEALAYMIEGFPLEPGRSCYGDRIEECREWLRNHPKYTLRR